MNAFATLLQDESVLRLGRTLLHFAWQGAAAALVAALLLLALRRAWAAARYVVLLCVFAAMAACPVVTFLALPDSAPSEAGPSAMYAQIRPEGLHRTPATALRPTGADRSAAATPASAGRAALSSRVRLASEWIERRLGWLAAAWALGVLVLSLRLGIGWIRLYHTRRAAEEVTEGPWRQTLNALCARLRISRPVHVLHSAAHQAPMVMGWLRPVILLPASAVTGLSSAQLQAIIAHELAHIRHHDYLVNLAQTVVETLLFYHPAVWWLSNRIRLEREHCCDDVAVGLCGDAVEYARALAELENLRGRTPQPAVVSAGGMLLGRVRRLLGSPPSEHSRLPSAMAAAFALASLLAIGVALQVSARASDTESRVLTANALFVEGAVQDTEAAEDRVRADLDTAAAPGEETPTSAAAPESTGDSKEVVYAIISLEHLPAGYIGSLFYPKFQLGPGPMLRLEERGGLGIALGALSDFLPAGIRFISATRYDSRRLLVAGTPEAIAELRHLIATLDGKPRDVGIQVSAWPASPTPEAPIELFDLHEPVRGAYHLKLGSASGATAAEIAHAFPSVEPHATEVTVPDLSSKLVLLPVRVGLAPIVLSLTPRLSGDKSIAVTLALTPMDNPDDPNCAIGRNAELLATVNVNSGEGFVIVLAKGKSAMTILIEPTILEPS